MLCKYGTFLSLIKSLCKKNDFSNGNCLNITNKVSFYNEDIMVELEKIPIYVFRNFIRKKF